MPSHPKGKQPKKPGKHPHGPQLPRSGSQAQAWEEAIGPSISIIPVNQLPQIKTVLQRYRALRIEQPLTKTYDLATIIAEETIMIWNRARVPIISRQSLINKVVEVINWWKSQHNTDRSLEQVDELFDIASKPRGNPSGEASIEHLKTLMRQGSSMQRRKSEGGDSEYDWEVDFKFYIDQKNDRKQTLGVADNKLHLAEAASEERKAKRARYYESQLSQPNEASTSTSSAEVNEACGANKSSSEATDDNEEYQPPPEPSSPNITLTLPRKKLLSGTAEVASRCNISHRNALAITAKLVKMGGEKLQKCSLSASTSLRQRTRAVAEAESKIMKDFKHDMPVNIVLHWDGKVIKYENRKETDERLAIIISSPVLDHSQFLAAPLIPDGTGASMKDALLTTLQVWEIPHENIIGMCWDTTASNTGRQQGSATLFKQELNRHILWLACRHHIGELHIKHADIATRGAWAGMV